MGVPVLRVGVFLDAMWDLYISRVIRPRDARFIVVGSLVAEHEVRFIVHRRKIRVLRFQKYYKVLWWG